MSTLVIKSGSTGETAEVDSNNRLQSFSVIQTASSVAAVGGDSYNVNTGIINLSTGGASALLYIKNIDSLDWVINRVFYNAEVSANGAGGWLAEIIANPTNGTLINNGVEITPFNFNFGSPKILSAVTLKGEEGSTVTGTDVRVSTIVPASGTRVLIGFDSIILDPGSSMIVRITPPAGNTSMNIQVGLNLYRKN